jgi:glycosyltransferase involved in cell wall biosynthesis
MIKDCRIIVIYYNTNFNIAVFRNTIFEMCVGMGILTKEYYIQALRTERDPLSYIFRARLWRVPYSNHCLSVHPSAKTLTLVMTFDCLVLGLSYFTCVFLLATPFI